MRKFVVLAAVIGAFAGSPSSALAAPMLTLSGTCERVDSFPDCPPPRRCEGIIAEAEASGALRHGEARSLRAKCDSAEASVASGHTKAARNKLKAFIHEVHAMLRSRRISSTLGQELIDSANARIASLP
jgi:hypothetical protein